MDTHTRSHTPRGVLVGRVYLHTYSLARRPFAIPARTPQREKVPLVTVPGPRCEWGGPALFVATGSAVGGPAQPGSRRSARGPGDHGRLAPSTQPVRAASSLQPAGRSITSPWRTPTSLPASLVTLQKYVTLHPGRHKSTPRTQLFSSETHFPAAVGFTKPDAETGEEHLSLVPGCVGGPRRGGLRLWHGMHSRAGAGREAGSRQVPPCPDGNPCAVLAEDSRPSRTPGVIRLCPLRRGLCVPPVCSFASNSVWTQRADHARFSAMTMTLTHCLHKGVLFLRPRMRV